MVRAKFMVTRVQQHYYGSHNGPVKGSVDVFLTPQYDTSIPEDQRYAKATPSGEIRLQIDNPAASEYLTPGEQFYVDFTAVPKSEPVSA
jgi:hypothetical protein